MVADWPVEQIAALYTGAELLFEVFSRRHERGSTQVTSILPFAEWTEVLGPERLTGALLDRLTHHVHILEMNGDSSRLKTSKQDALPSGPSNRTPRRHRACVLGPAGADPYEAAGRALAKRKPAPKRRISPTLNSED
jgi:hypothetical protein